MSKIARFALSVAFCLCAQLQAAREVEVAELGIRLEHFLFPPEAGRGRQFDVARVLAVREGGPAYNAGVAPGDVVRAVGTRQTLSPESIAQLVSYQYKPGQQLDLHVSYPIPGGWQMQPDSIRITVGLPAQGRWITQAPRHSEFARGKVPGLVEYRQAAKAKYEQQRKASMATVSKGCMPLEEVRRIAGDLAQLADAAYMGDQGDIYTLQQTRASACQNAATGELPQFEKALYAMTDARRLDPCAYNPATDYSPIFNDPSYQTFQSKTYYEAGSRARFQIFLRRADEVQAKCFLDLIEAQLTGALWTPRRTASSVRTSEASSLPANPKPVLDPPKPRTSPETTQELKAFQSARTYASGAGEAAAIDAVRREWQTYLANGNSASLQQALRLLREYQQRMSKKRSLGVEFTVAWQSANRLLDLLEAR